MADELAIKVKDVSKTFKLPYEKNTSIKHAFISFYRRNKGYERQEVLNKVSFEVKKGDFFGIVGRNGSGKSTLLKLLAGIYSPDAGEIQINGKLTPFIELGVGFNPELSGRENVFLNGALLGFNRKEMEAMYDEIVEFAELERFMDQKLKNYSSGMQVRLAFSIAIQAKTDILVLDEVLAVGDEAFQQKCVDVFEEYKSSKQTVILVTHDMSSVKKYCNKAILINEGSIIASGQPADIAAKYSKLNYSDPADPVTSSELVNVRLQNGSGKESKKFNQNESMTVEVSIKKSNKKIKNIGIAIIKNSGEYVNGANTIQNKISINQGDTLKYTVKLDIGAGKYHISYGLFGDDGNKIIDFVEKGPEFIVSVNPDSNQEGIAMLNHEWTKL